VGSADEGEREANGVTPLDDDEAEGLIPGNVRTKSELNAWEALNIARAEERAFSRNAADPLSVDALQDLHRRMFDETWSWAGKFRRSDKNVSPYHWSQVPTLLHDLVRDTRAQYDASTRTPETLDEIAVRFHYRLVRIHAWPNGNGRHARLATDLLLRYWGQPPFTWGNNSDLISQGTARTRYLVALRAADEGAFGLLREFVRS
jgi:Fic-DOC domain mobile mystery protein B